MRDELCRVLSDRYKATGTVPWSRKFGTPKPLGEVFLWCLRVARSLKCLPSSRQFQVTLSAANTLPTSTWSTTTLQRLQPSLFGDGQSYLWIYACKLTYPSQVDNALAYLSSIVAQKQTNGLKTCLTRHLQIHPISLEQTWCCQSNSPDEIL